MPLDLVLDDCHRLRIYDLTCVWRVFFLSYVFCVIHALIIAVISRQFKRPQNLTVLFFGTDKRLFDCERFAIQRKIERRCGSFRNVYMSLCAM